MPAATNIREATAGDLSALADTLATAFEHYPWTRWVVDHEDHHRRLCELYGIYLRIAVRFGRVWMADDASGAAAWTWSGENAAQAEYLQSGGLDTLIGRLSGERAEQAATAEAVLAPHSLREPHWNLAAVGVLPAQQGKGLGTRLLTPMLDLCDTGGHIAALETSSPANVRLYQRLDFEIRRELEVPDGPHIWLMQRPRNRPLGVIRTEFSPARPFGLS